MSACAHISIHSITGEISRSQSWKLRGQHASKLSRGRVYSYCSIQRDTLVTCRLKSHAIVKR